MDNNAKFNEIKAAIVEAMKNPDTMEASMGDVLKTLEADYTAYETFIDKYENAEKRIRDLQDTNHKLFLAQTGEPDQQEEETQEAATGIEVINEFMEKIKKMSE